MRDALKSASGCDLERVHYALGVYKTLLCYAQDTCAHWEDEGRWLERVIADADKLQMSVLDEVKRRAGKVK